ncbi:MAG: trigger factor [Candidatus Omnitrophica bacterium]|nr:trigger factor [Candidatus Omnitrophota bacterium]MCM8790541.1 trigger factor [Candidatus Omnitrophota bacterium]
MKSKAKSLEECSTLFEIEVSKEAIARVFDEVYNDIAKAASIPGFRVGKAPIEMVRLHYAKDARQEVLKRLIPQAYRRALQEHDIHPVSLPEISDVIFEEDKPLTFKARVDTRPKFKLKEYKGLALEKKKVSISDADIDKMLQNLRELNAKYISIDDRAVKMGDYVVGDLECFVDGKPIHKKRENLWVAIDKDSFVVGLSENMVGMKKGEEKDIEVTLPEKYPDKAFAGKRATYHVLIKEIKERKLSDLNDDFAKEMGKANLDELRKEIASEMESHAKANADIELENSLLNKLMDDNVFSVPSAFVTRQLDYMVEDAKRRLIEKGFKKEDLDKRDAEFKERFKNDAVRQVRLLFILDEIATREHIKADEEDLNNAYRAIAAQNGKKEEEVRAYYESQELVDNLAEKIREGKTIRFLLDNAKISEKE